MEDNKELNLQVEPDSKDINSNVGSFSTSVVPPVQEAEKPVENKVVAEQEKDPLINFERFEKTKKRRNIKPAHTSFGIKVETWLSSPKKLAIVWATIAGIIAVLWAFQIFYVAQIHIMLKNKDSGPMNIPAIYGCAMSGLVFSYLSILLPLLPILFLITSWFVGINAVHASKIFHYIFWTILLVCIVFFVVGSCCSWISIIDYWQFNGYTPPSS